MCTRCCHMNFLSQWTTCFHLCIWTWPNIGLNFSTNGTRGRRTWRSGSRAWDQVWILLNSGCWQTYSGFRRDADILQLSRFGVSTAQRFTACWGSANNQDARIQVHSSCYDCGAIETAIQTAKSENFVSQAVLGTQRWIMRSGNKRSRSVTTAGYGDHSAKRICLWAQQFRVVLDCGRGIKFGLSTISQSPQSVKRSQFLKLLFYIQLMLLAPWCRSISPVRQKLNYHLNLWWGLLTYQAHIGMDARKLRGLADAQIYGRTGKRCTKVFRDFAGKRRSKKILNDAHCLRLFVRLLESDEPRLGSRKWALTATWQTPPQEDSRSNCFRLVSNMYPHLLASHSNKQLQSWKIEWGRGPTAPSYPKNKKCVMLLRTAVKE